MAKLSSYRNLTTKDYKPEYQELVDSLSLIINSSFNELYNALNNKLTFQDNFAATVTSITLAVDKNGNPTKKTSFKLQNGQTSYSMIFVGNVTGGTPIGGVFVLGTLDSGVVTVKNIQGLQPLINYTLQLLVI